MNEAQASLPGCSLGKSICSFLLSGKLATAFSKSVFSRMKLPFLSSLLTTFRKGEFGGREMSPDDLHSIPGAHTKAEERTSSQSHPLTTRMFTESWSLPIKLSWLTSKFQRFACLCLHNARFTSTSHHIQLFRWALRIKRTGEYFTYWSLDQLSKREDTQVCPNSTSTGPDLLA